MTEGPISSTPSPGLGARLSQRKSDMELVPAKYLQNPNDLHCGRVGRYRPSAVGNAQTPLPSGLGHANNSRFRERKMLD